MDTIFDLHFMLLWPMMIIHSSTTENVKSKVKKTQLNLQMVKNCLFLNCKKIVLVVFFFVILKNWPATVI